MSTSSQFTIQDEITLPGNATCAECCSPEPTFASLSLGVFVCQACSAFHEKLPPNRNKIVPVLTHRWTVEEVDLMHGQGNQVVNAEYEKHLPYYYHRPTAEDPPILREQWIKAKYEREEFKDVSQQSCYNQGSKTGALFKRAKDNDRFQRRKFVLKEPEGCLQYYIKYSDKSPKDSINIRNLVNVYMVPDKVGNKNGMQITHEKDGVRRNLFLFGEDGKNTSDWFHAIRHSMAKHKYENFPESEVERFLDTSIIREGWMSKTGPRKLEKFRKRWFSLIGTMVWYYTQPLDPHPLGCIPLGSKTFGYGVMKGYPQGVKIGGFGLTIHTPDRVFVLNCETMDSRDRWVKCVDVVLESCTRVWAQPAVGRLGSKTAKAVNLDEVPDLDKPSENSVLTGLPVVRQKASDTDSVASEETTGKKTSLFTKNTDKKASSSATSGKHKNKTSSRRRRGSTKLHFTAAKDFEADGNVIANGIATGSNPCSPHQTLMMSPSKKYSDDSDDLSCDGTRRDANRYSISTVTDFDSEEDVVVLLQVSHDSMSNLLDLNSDKSYVEKNVRSEEAAADSTPKAMHSTPIKTPKKPPRQKKSASNEVEAAASGLSDSESKATEEKFVPLTPSPSVAESPKPSPRKNVKSLIIASETENLVDAVPAKKAGSCENLVSMVPSLPTDASQSQSWRERTFTSIRRVGGHERKTIISKKSVKRESSLARRSSMTTEKDVSPRPIDVTLVNQMDESLWFMVFQSEKSPDPVESYVTPWVGTQIAESPASVGPLRIPNVFEIAVMDTAPGGFGLKRTTGPFYAEPGDIWEVDISADDGSAPEMFYHEGMETDDGSVIVYANIANVKKFDVVVYKSERKLLSRHGLKAGDSVNVQIKPSLYLLSATQERFAELEGEDIRSSECLADATCIDINYRAPKMKVFAKKRGNQIFFTR